MENCLLEGNRICSLDINNEYGNKDYNLIRKWKNAQNKNLLICEDCGMPVDFRAGKVRTPYFAHKKGATDRACYYETHKETEEHRDAKKLFYEYFKYKYSDSLVETNKKFSNGKRTDLLVTFKTGEKLAIEFLRSLVNVSEWEERHLNMAQAGILDLWFFSINLFNKEGSGSKYLEFLPWVTERETSGGTALFLNVHGESLTLVKIMEYKDEAGKVKDQKIFSEEYNLKSVEIQPNGFILCEFNNHYQEAKSQFFATCKFREDEEKARYERMRGKYQQQSDFDNNYQQNNQRENHRNNLSIERTFSSAEVNVSRIPSKWEVEMSNQGPAKALEILEKCKQTPLMQELSCLSIYKHPNDEGIVKLMKAAETMLLNWKANPIPANKNRAIMRIGRLASQVLGCKFE